MNSTQTRVLQECEFRFYVATDPQKVSETLRMHGFKPNPDLTRISDESLRILCGVLRQSLRSV